MALHQADKSFEVALKSTSPTVDKPLPFNKMLK